MKYNGDTVKAWAGNSQWRALRADLSRCKMSGYSGWGSEGFWVLAVYRMQRAVRSSRSRRLLLPATLLLSFVKKFLTLITHINLHPDAIIGPGFLIVHIGPIQVAAGVTFGADCAIHHVCTVGSGARPGKPTIGDHVMLGCHTCVLGPVHVGDGAVIGAGAVVVTDIPPWSVAVGVPARVAKMNLRPEERTTFPAMALHEVASLAMHNGHGVFLPDDVTAPSSIAMPSACAHVHEPDCR